MIEHPSIISTGLQAHDGDRSIDNISDFTRASPVQGYQNSRIPSTSSKLKPECRDITEVYRLGEQIGAGSYSVVKYAEHKKTGEPVAIKIIDKSTMNLKQISNVLLEAEILKNLKHEYILGFKDFFIEMNQMCIVTDYSTMNALNYAK